jgi:FkbM family methyltransferase
MRIEPSQAYKELEEQYFGDNKHESLEIDRLPELLDGVRCFVDVGASLGQYSYFAAKALKGAKFFCVEADPDKVKRLRELTGKWAEATRNEFAILEKAASDRQEVINFFVPENHLSSGAFFPLAETAAGWEKVEVEADTLDRLFEGVDVDFLKLDVEGAEYRALVGAEQLMKRCDLRLLLEISPWGDKDHAHRPFDVLKLLASYGYDFSVFEDHYLYEKRGSGLSRWVKSRTLGFVLDHPGFKARVKGVFNRLRGRK